jgi:hypothetical protein
VSAPPKIKGGLLHAPIPITNCTPSLTSLSPQVKLISHWPNGAGVTRIQTRCPSIARELRRLKETRQVGESVTGGYLRLFDSTQRLGKLRKVLKKIEKANNTNRGAFLPRGGLRKSPVNAPEARGSIRTAATSNRCSEGVTLVRGVE